MKHSFPPFIEIGLPNTCQAELISQTLSGLVKSTALNLPRLRLSNAMEDLVEVTASKLKR